MQRACQALAIKVNHSTMKIYTYDTKQYTLYGNTAQRAQRTDGSKASGLYFRHRLLKSPPRMMGMSGTAPPGAQFGFKLDCKKSAAALHNAAAWQICAATRRQVFSTRASFCIQSFDCSVDGGREAAAASQTEFASYLCAPPPPGLKHVAFGQMSAIRLMCSCRGLHCGWQHPGSSRVHRFSINGYSS